MAIPGTLLFDSLLFLAGAGLIAFLVYRWAMVALQLAGGPPQRLTPLELRLLQLLLAHGGEEVAADRILNYVWGAKGGGDRQLLKQLVHRLREKIEKDPAQPRWLLTAPGVGYRLATGSGATKTAEEV